MKSITFAFGNRCAIVNTALLRRKRQSMIKLLCNKCNGCASSSSHRFQICGSPLEGLAEIAARYRQERGQAMKDGAAPRADVGIKSRRNGLREHHKRVEGSWVKRTKGAKRQKGAQRWIK